MRCARWRGEEGRGAMAEPARFDVRQREGLLLNRIVVEIILYPPRGSLPRATTRPLCAAVLELAPWIVFDGSHSYRFLMEFA